MRARPIQFSLILAAVCLSVTACGQTSAPPPAAPAGKKVDPSTAGSISGTVTFSGPRPPQELLKVTSDPACVQGAGPTPPSQSIVIGPEGGLRNAFVYVKGGLDPEYAFDVPTSPVRLDQQACQYEPRVLGIRVAQPLEVSNDDPTFHNVHGLPQTNQEFNQSLKGRGSRLIRTFTVPEVMVRFKCDVHGWMTAYVGVMTHPFFAVTGADGSFTLTGLPPGTYTLEAWHERFGTRTVNVTVAATQTQNASLVFTKE